MAGEGAVRMHTCTLQVPIEIDGQTVTEITLRKPHVPDLTGLALYRVLECNATEVAKLLQRITSPALDAAALARLDPADFFDLGARLSLFFVKRQQIEATAKALHLDPQAEEATAA